MGRNQNAFLSSYEDRSAEFEANRSKSALLASAGDPFLCIESAETDVASRPKSGCDLLFRYSVARAGGEPGNPTVRFQNPDRSRSVSRSVSPHSLLLPPQVSLHEI